MDISCDVIRDLLPMYVEELTSDASRELVDEHLRSCEECTRHLGVMRKAQVIPVDVEVESLKRVGNTIRRRRILAMLSVIMVVISLAASVYTWLTVPIALPMEKAVVSVEKIPEGGIRQTLFEYACAHIAVGSGLNKGYVSSTNRVRQLMWKYSPYKTIQMEEHGTLRTEDGRDIPFINDQKFLDWYGGEILHWAHEYNYWYLNIYTGVAENLMWDSGAEHPEDMQMMKPDYTWFYVLAVSLVSLIVLLIGSRHIKHNKASLMMQRGAVLAGSIAYSTVITCGTRFVSLSGIYDDLTIRGQYIAVLSLVVAFAGCFCLHVHRLNRLEKLQ